MRLDKFLCELNIGSRSQVKKEIKLGNVSVNGKLIKDADHQINEASDCITYRGQELSYSKFKYYMLNKPQGVVSATNDLRETTVIDLLPESLRKNIFPAGRLDKDTEGFLLLTNDGELSHRLLAPKKHVDKVYLVGISQPLRQEELALLSEGVDIGEQKPTAPAKVEVISEKQILLTIHEGKFHQVKRMLAAVGNKVVTLKRVTFAGIPLDTSLQPGEWRELTKEELEQLNAID